MALKRVHTKPLNMTGTHITPLLQLPCPSHITRTSLASMKLPVKTPPGETKMGRSFQQLLVNV